MGGEVSEVEDVERGLGGEVGGVCGVDCVSWRVGGLLGWWIGKGREGGAGRTCDFFSWGVGADEELDRCGLARVWGGHC